MNDEVGLFGYLNRVHELGERTTALDKLNESIYGGVPSLVKTPRRFRFVVVV
jgi:hypothetical protein